MASTALDPHHPAFTLTPLQQQALYTALQSNQPTTLNPASTGRSSLSYNESVPEQTPSSATLNGFEESPFIDYDYEFDNDGSFGDYDFANTSQGQMIGNLPGGSSDGDAGTNEKRSHSEDEDDEDGGGKRREGDDKGSKKPGRKPLTSEPTSKRKAQNRAAQRAFRERKEKHLKDLETKVQDLEKASESANHENSILRAQVEKMAVELKEYRKGMSASGNGAVRGQPTADPSRYLQKKGLGNTVNNPSDVNFQFEFPKFGRLPGPPVVNGSSTMSSSSTSSPTSSHGNGKVGPLGQTLKHTPSYGSSTTGVSPLSQTQGDNLADFSALFTPATLDTIAMGTTLDYMSHVASTASRSSMDSANGPNSTGQNTSHSSPASTNSNNGLTSSCGTSPEPYTQSPPASKALENTLTTIGEENHTNQGQDVFCDKLSMACGNPNNPIPRTMSGTGLSPANFDTPGFDVNGIDWFAQQNGNQFDPQLFGDYREPQENILSGGLYDDTFFNEAFAMPDFHSPFILDASPAAPKKDLVQEIDSKLNDSEEVVPAEGQMLSCTTMWEKIQACPRIQNGEIDMDSLCTQLQQKAKCSGDGPVIQENDFQAVINSMFPPTPASG